jgi:hypothetical protein
MGGIVSKGVSQENINGIRRNLNSVKGNIVKLKGYKQVNVQNGAEEGEETNEGMVTAVMENSKQAAVSASAAALQAEQNAMKKQNAAAKAARAARAAQNKTGNANSQASKNAQAAAAAAAAAAAKALANAAKLRNQANQANVQEANANAAAARLKLSKTLEGVPLVVQPQVQAQNNNLLHFNKVQGAFGTSGPNAPPPPLGAPPPPKIPTLKRPPENVARNAARNAAAAAQRQSNSNAFNSFGPPPPLPPRRRAAPAVAAPAVAAPGAPGAAAPRAEPNAGQQTNENELQRILNSIKNQESLLQNNTRTNKKEQNQLNLNKLLKTKAELEKRISNSKAFNSFGTSQAAAPVVPAVAAPGAAPVAAPVAAAPGAAPVAAAPGAAPVAAAPGAAPVAAAVANNNAFGEFKSAPPAPAAVASATPAAVASATPAAEARAQTNEVLSTPELQAALNATAAAAPAAAAAVQAVQLGAVPQTLEEARKKSAALAETKTHASPENKSIIGKAQNAIAQIWGFFAKGGSRKRRAHTRSRRNRRNTKKNRKNHI